MTPRILTFPSPNRGPIETLPLEQKLKLLRSLLGCRSRLSDHMKKLNDHMAHLNGHILRIEKDIEALSGTQFDDDELIG